MPSRIVSKHQLSPYISSILPSPDGNQVVISTAENVCILDAQSMETLSTLPLPDTTQIRWDSNGLWYSNRDHCGLIDTKSGMQVSKLKSRIL